MYLELQQQSVLLGRRPSGFTEHYYTEWDDGLGKEKVSLFLVMSIDSTQVPGAELGKEAFQLLQDHFLEDVSEDPYDRFEAALREINLMINDKEKELDMHFIPNMHVLVGVIQKDMLYLSQRGAAQGYLIRKRHVSSITDGLADESNKEDLFQNIASGALEVSDSVVFVTGPLVQYVSAMDMSKIFSEQSLHGAVGEISDMLESDLEDQMALLGFEILEKSHVTIVEEPEIGEAPMIHLDAEDEEDEIVLSGPSRSEQIKESFAKLQNWAAKKAQWKWLDRIKNWNKQQVGIAITVLVAVLVVGVGVSYVGNGVGAQKEEMQLKLGIAEDNVTKAATEGVFKKREAESLLNEAEAFAIEVLNSGHLGGQASQVLDDIQVQRDFLDNVMRIDKDSVTLVADLGGVLGSAEVVGLAPVEDRLIAYTEHEAYQILLGDVQDPDILDNTEKVQGGTYFSDRDTVMLVTDDGNVLEYEPGNAQFMDTSDGSFKPGTDIASYSTRIYILDTEGDQIWKYTRGTSGFGYAQAYMDEGEVDLTNAVSMAIDGNVWILHEDGMISRVLSGENVPYYILEAPLTSIEGATSIYTELDVSQIYVVDPDNDRILTYDKTAKSDDITYGQQYVFEDLKGDLRDVYMDKDRNALMIATTEAIYELSF